MCAGFAVRLTRYAPTTSVLVADAVEDLARILAAAAPKLVWSVREIVVDIGCILLGNRRCHVRTLAQACGMSSRTLERRLGKSASPQQGGF
jgi:AraC-like DNA-binding protein